MRSTTVLGAVTLVAFGWFGCGSEDATPATTGTGGDGGVSHGGSGGTGGGESFALEVAFEPCPLVTGANDAFAECATIEVPLDWDDPGGRTIELFLKRKAATVAPSTSQVWFLAGGPGQASADFEPLVDSVDGAAPAVSFYMLDHRGVGRSTRLGCPEQESLASEGANQITVDEMPDCLAAVVEQFSADELAHFSTTQAARDVGELISHLRGPNESAVIWGGSYGTHWANRYAELYPSQADAIVLGALAIGGELATIDGRFDDLARNYLDLCDADVCATTIGASFGQPSRDLAVATLSGAGKTLCPEIEALGWNVTLLKTILGQQLYSFELRKLIPVLIYRAARCSPADVNTFAAFGQALSQPVAMLPPSQQLWGMFMTHHVIKSELWTNPPIARAELEAIVDDAIAINGTSSLLIESFDEWPRYEAPQDQYASPTGRVMMVHGELDFTPPSLYQPAVDHFLGLQEDNLFFLLPGATHGLASPTPGGFNCGPSMMWTFASEFDQAPADCTGDIIPIDFALDPSSSASLLGTPDPWEGDPGQGLAPAAPPEALGALRARLWRLVGGHLAGLGSSEL